MNGRPSGRDTGPKRFLSRLAGLAGGAETPETVSSLLRAAAAGIVRRIEPAKKPPPSPENVERMIADTGRRLAQSTKPIIVGPWLSEVGFEVLYWIPFVTALVRRFRIEPSRLRVLTRGGVRSWYAHITDGYVDIFQHLEPAAFVALNERRTGGGFQKHMLMGDVDEEIIRASLGPDALETHEILHPSLMYGAFLGYWSRVTAPREVKIYSDYQPFRRPVSSNAPALEGPYTAAKFYFSGAFPKTEANQRFIAEMIARLASRSRVVLLRNETTYDDHSDADFPLPAGVELFTPRNPKTNLEDQSTIIAGAERFVGTYGGFSYIAPFYGVPSLSFYSNIERLVPVHMDIALRIFREFRTGEFDKNSPLGAEGVAPSAVFSIVDVRSWV